jgi:hypothetical protein
MHLDRRVREKGDAAMKALEELNNKEASNERRSLSCERMWQLGMWHSKSDVN